VSRGPSSRRSRRRRRWCADYIASLPADRFPNLVAVADYHAITDPDLRFDLLLDIYVEGLAKRASER
jgi:hypothetical protein